MEPLLARTLILAAHPDDESIAAGALMQRIKEPLIVIATDGAPYAPEHDAEQERLRLDFASRRRKEMLHAASVVHAPVAWLESRDGQPFIDQQLYRALEEAILSAEAVIKDRKPEALLSHAYEGGHPDHDACAFIARVLSDRFRLPLWEMPLYHAATGEWTPQQWLAPIEGSDESLLEVTPAEMTLKLQMLQAHASQAQMLKRFDAKIERFRPAPRYDFSHPPHEGALNYELWGWSMTGADLSRAFTQYLAKQARKAA